jgi:Protein of unknown function (DUF1018)
MNAATKLIAKLNVAKKQLGLDEDTYRDALETATGKRSVKAMSEAERLRALAHFEARGFNGRVTRRPGGDLKLTGRYAGKLQALWIAGWNLGLVRNRDDKALLAFVKRQTGIDHTRFLRDGEDAMKAIEALKAWLAREGVAWHHGPITLPHATLSGFKIAQAQWIKLNAGEEDRVPFFESVKAISGVSPMGMTQEADWIPVMNDFGERVRASRRAQAGAPQHEGGR